MNGPASNPREESSGGDGVVGRRSGADPDDNRLETLVLHAFLDLIGERKARGRTELVATMETIATWLSDRTGLPLKASHVQAMTLALRDGGILDVGGYGIGRPNSYDTREAEMGVGPFWDQVDALLMVWRLPNRDALIRAMEPPGAS